MTTEFTEEQLAEATRLYALLDELTPKIKAIRGVAAKASAVGIAKRRFVVHLKKDAEETRAAVRALVAQHCDLEVDFVVPPPKK